MAKKKKNKKNLHELKEELVEDLAIGVENDEIKNDDPLEDLEEANGQVEDDSQEEIQEIGDLEYTDGKERTKADLIAEQEKIFGTDILSPFGTASMDVFQEKIQWMDVTQLQSLAERNGLPQVASVVEQNEILINGFRDWVGKNGSISDIVPPLQETVAEKGALSDAFEEADSVKDLEEKLKSKTLSDLQSSAARLGFNPGFDRDRLIELIKQEYRKQLS